MPQVRKPDGKERVVWSGEMMKEQALIFSFFFLALLLMPVAAFAESPTAVYFFYGEGCPHCAQEMEFLEEVYSSHPDLEIRSFEIYYNQDNYDIFRGMCDAYGCSHPYSVPTLFVGDKYFVGYAESYNRAQIEGAIENCLLNWCADPSELEPSAPSEYINLPLIGDVKISDVSLPVVTVVLGLMDGFNPCAMFILCFLLVFLIGTKSRKRVFLVGGIFLLVSGIVYFLFISAWFNFFVVFSYVPILKFIVAGLVVVAGIINIKDYFFFQKGLSLTLPKSWKPKVMERMKKLASIESIPALVLGVITIAFVVNVVELMCTIGFPMIYTQILSSQNLPQLTYYLYIMAYCILYMVDDLILFSIAVVTLNCVEMTQKRIRIMKLFSGAMMIALAIWFVLG